MVLCDESRTPQACVADCRSPLGETGDASFELISFSDDRMPLGQFHEIVQEMAHELQFYGNHPLSDPISNWKGILEEAKDT